MFSSRKILTFINLFCMFEYFNVSVYNVDQKQATEKAEMNLIFLQPRIFLMISILKNQQYHISDRIFLHSREVFITKIPRFIYYQGAVCSVTATRKAI